MNGIPVVLIVTCVVIGLCALSGLLAGFVRKISGIVSFVLACVLVSVLLPTITSALRTTPVYTVIRGQCEAIGNNIVRSTVAETVGGTGTSVTAAGGTAAAQAGSEGAAVLDRDRIKAALQERGYDPSIIDALSDQELQSYVQQMIGATAGMFSGSVLFSVAQMPCCILTLDGASELQTAPAAGAGTQDGTSLLSKLTSGMDRSEQIRFIEDLPVPDFLKEQMVTFNNAAGYVKLGAADFGSYIINYIANLILNILAFLVTLLVSWLIIRLLLGALSVFSALPVIGGADRLLGLAAGVAQGVLIVWVLFLILSIFSTTPVGKTMMDEIIRTPVLELLYNMNPLAGSAANALKGLL